MTTILQNRTTTQSTGRTVSLGYIVLGSFNEHQVKDWISSNNIEDKVKIAKIVGLACNGKPRFEVTVPESVLADKNVSPPPQLLAV